MSTQGELRATGDILQVLEAVRVGAALDADQLRVLHSFERYRLIGDLLASADAAPVVVDVGCGYANNLFRAVASRLSRASVFATDVNRDVCAENAINFPSIVSIHSPSLDSLPRIVGGDRTVCVACMEVLGHEDVPDDVQLLSALASVAGEGQLCIASIGRFEAGSSHEPHSYFERSYGAAEFVALWERAGFDLARMRWFGQHHPANRIGHSESTPVRRTDPGFENYDFMIGVGIAP